jgi:hypothetical protein
VGLRWKGKEGKKEKEKEKEKEPGGVKPGRTAVVS